MVVLRRLLLFGMFLGLIGIMTHFVALPVAEVAFTPNQIRMVSKEIEQRQDITRNRFLKTVYQSELQTDSSRKTYVDLKLFGFLKVRRIAVDTLPVDYVFAGGALVGFAAKSDGVIVLADFNGYKRGDIITSINSRPVRSVADVQNILTETNLGLWIKDEVNGIGTITYIDPTNNNYAALGHKLVDSETGARPNLRGGDVYMCNVIGLRKSHSSTIGVFEATLKKSQGVQGSITSSNDYGVYGCLDDKSRILEMCRNRGMSVASRYSVKPGKASILTSLDGETIEEFEIQIVKNRFQNVAASKGLTIRITDPRLLNRAGGIIHGMSGSPIIQDGKLIGAVTHVMTTDVTRGYGIYIDFMMP